MFDGFDELYFGSRQLCQHADPRFFRDVSTQTAKPEGSVRTQCAILLRLPFLILAIVLWRVALPLPARHENDERARPESGVKARLFGFFC